MSNGIDILGGRDFAGGFADLGAARRDIREARAEERAAEGHFKLAKEQFQDADKARADGNIFDAWQHEGEGYRELDEGKKHLDHARELSADAWKEIAAGRSKLGDDPACGMPGPGDPGCDTGSTGRKGGVTARDAFFEGLK